VASVAPITSASCTTVANEDSAAPASAPGNNLARPCALSHGADCGDAGHEAAEQSRDGQAPTRSEPALRHIACRIDQHHDQRQAPHEIRIQRTPGIDGAIGQQRQNNHRRTSEQDCIAELALGQCRLRKCVQSCPRCKQHRDDDSEASGERRARCCEYTYTEGRQQRDFRCETGIVGAAAPVRNRCQYHNSRRQDRHQPRRVEYTRQRAQQRDQRKSAHTGCSARVALALASLAFDANQQSGTERNRERAERPRNRSQAAHRLSPDR